MTPLVDFKQSEVVSSSDALIYNYHKWQQKHNDSFV